MATMQPPLFNKLAQVQAVKSAHVDQEQASARADALETALLQGVATPSLIAKAVTSLCVQMKTFRAEPSDQIKHLCTELKADIAGVESRIEGTMHDIISWMIGAMLTLAAMQLGVTGLKFTELRGVR